MSANHIFEKIGVDNRNAATVRALEVLGSAKSVQAPGHPALAVLSSNRRIASGTETAFPGIADDFASTQTRAEGRVAEITNFFTIALKEATQSDRISLVNNSSACVISVPAWKRLLDVFCIILALPGVLFFMLVLAVLIKLVSRGPVLIRQERIGLGRRRFRCFKFRTMHMCADTGVHQRHLQQLLRSDMPMVKMDSIGDPRLIRFGAILRAIGLDELPQLINVLRGEMSLVGPRPCLPYEFDLYQPWQHERFNTLPGLTGLWQVRGKNKTTFAEMIQLDIQYARTKSLLLDLQILAATFGTLASQAKAVRQRPNSKAGLDAEQLVLKRS